MFKGDTKQAHKADASAGSKPVLTRYPHRIFFPAVNPLHLAQPIRKRINIRCFDFDGCLFNKAYYELYDKLKKPDTPVQKNLLNGLFYEANKDLFDSIDQELTAANFHKVFYTVGSARQSWQFDRNCSSKNKSGSCFPFMKTIKERFKKGEVNEFLLTDLYNDLPHGTCFTEAMGLLKKKDNSASEHGWVFDDSKFSILYAQIHKFANEHPDEDIDFDFYDDRDDILQPLHTVFKAHPHLLPNNVTLKMHKYDGKPVHDMEELKGIGPIDKTYSRTVKELIKAHGIRCCDSSTFNLLMKKNQINVDKILAIRPEHSVAPVYPEVPWYKDSQNITTALGAGLGFFAGLGLVGGAVGGYVLYRVADSISVFNQRK